MKQYLAVDVGGTYVKAAVMDAEAHILYRLPKQQTAQESQNALVDLLEETYHQATAATMTMIDGIALSVPGLVDEQRGVMHTGGSLFCVQELPLAECLRQRCHCPVTLENDAKCATLAEAWQGELMGCQLGIAVIIGTAIGGGLVLNGRVLHGAHGMTGEFSYLMTNAANPQERRNLMAEQCGVPGLIRIAAEQLHQPLNRISSEEIFRLALAGSGEHRAVLRRYAERLTVQLLNLQAAFDPEKIVIGGGISEQPLLIELIEEAAQKLRQVYPQPLPEMRVAACRFHNDANLIGAMHHHLTMLSAKEKRS